MDTLLQAKAIRVRGLFMDAGKPHGAEERLLDNVPFSLGFKANIYLRTKDGIQHRVAQWGMPAQNEVGLCNGTFHFFTSPPVHPH